MDESKPTIDIWLIEDHHSYGERLKRSLGREKDLTCSRLFSSCEDAILGMKKETPPNLLLVDIELPGMSGIEGIPQFREHAPDTDVVILTVFEDEEKIFNAICAGACGYLLKTSSQREIAAAIRSTVAGGSSINPIIARRVLDRFATTQSQKNDYQLTDREKETLSFLVEGLTIKETASRLEISYHTADDYIRSIYRKLQVNSRGGAVAKALKEKLV
tara:strand:- start:2167 stop:2817 length:651 start_codon:yes stop_codon:yes gene_type:complete